MSLRKIKPCKCGGRPRLSKEAVGIFKFAMIRCKCGLRTNKGDYMWLSDEDRDKCIVDWNSFQQ